MCVKGGPEGPPLRLTDDTAVAHTRDADRRSAADTEVSNREQAEGDEPG
jgi:hypothetical protein